jgi:hypothetical protein
MVFLDATKWVVENGVAVCIENATSEFHLAIEWYKMV